MELLWFLLVGAVSGWLAGQLFKGGGFGLLGNIVIGVLGSVIGGWFARELGIGGPGLLWHILIAAGGGWVLLFLISLIKK